MCIIIILLSQFILHFSVSYGEYTFIDIREYTQICFM